MAGHPENAQRLVAIMRVLEKEGVLEKTLSIAPRQAKIAEIEYVHSAHYIARVKSFCEKGGGYLDPDTYVLPSSFEIALLAVGGVLAATDAVIEGKVRNALALVRPPGHHALRDRGMGFCIFNNIAIAAKYAQKKYGLKKVLIIDWDVHHGNGTQEVFYSDPSVLFASFHQYPHYPGTGDSDETGEGDGKGFTLNFPLSWGSQAKDFLHIFNNVLIPRAKDFSPEIIFISAGFDAHISDPLNSLRLTASDFGKFTDIVGEIARSSAEGRIVSVLEGGYNLEYLPQCVLAHLNSLLS
jgi:acetoin utilization deacetylase AcuC-like enzyme